MGDEDGCKGWERGCPETEGGFPGVDMEDNVVDVVVLPRLGVLPTSRECGAKGDGFSHLCRL